MLIVAALTQSLSEYLKLPEKLGADVVVGEGQSLGNSPSFGGPGPGFSASKESLYKKDARKNYRETKKTAMDAQGMSWFFRQGNSISEEVRPHPTFVRTMHSTH